MPKRQNRGMPPTNPRTHGTNAAFHEMAPAGHRSSATNARSIRRSRRNEHLARDAQRNVRGRNQESIHVRRHWRLTLKVRGTQRRHRSGRSEQSSPAVVCPFRRPVRRSHFRRHGTCSERLRLERRASRQGTKATVAAEATLRPRTTDHGGTEGHESSATHARSSVRSRLTERFARAARRNVRRRSKSSFHVRRHWRLTFDMRGGRKQAKPAGGRPLDGRVRRHVIAGSVGSRP
jgi:plasmid maintenance system killer protein